MVNLYQADEAFRDVVFRADLLEMACELLGPRVRLFRDQVFFKPAGVGGEVYMPQDNRYWHLNPPLPLNLWVGLGDRTGSNGWCVGGVCVCCAWESRSGRCRARARPGRTVCPPRSGCGQDSGGASPSCPRERQCASLPGSALVTRESQPLREEGIYDPVHGG